MRVVGNDTGFTLIELMIVVLIIGILVAIAIPVFAGARVSAQRNACYSNERVVEGAYSRYVSTEASGATSLATWSQLVGAIVPSEIATAPICPGNGSYSWGDRTVRCTVHGTYHQ